MAGHCQSKIGKLSSKLNSYNPTMTDKRLIKNVVSNLASQLQELTTNFRKNQNAYLKKIQSRKERSNMLFDTSQYTKSSSSFMTEDNGLNEENHVKLNKKKKT